MRRLAVLLISAGILAVPVAAVAHPGQPRVHPSKSHVPRQVARHACIAERTQLGKVSFKAKYGATKTLANCVKSKLPATRQARKTCLGERRQLGVKAFRAKYPGISAVRVCVRDATGG